MWLFVLFDLPVKTKEERSRYTEFRNYLLLDGFEMKQYSIYIRHCPSKENAQVHINRVKSAVPCDGKVSILMITDKQFSLMINFWGAIPEKPPDPPEQLMLF